MLMRRQRDRAGLRKRGAAIKMQLVDQSPIGDEQLCVARELHQPIVKGQIGLVIGVEASSLMPVPTPRRALDAIRVEDPEIRGEAIELSLRHLAKRYSFASSA